MERRSDERWKGMIETKVNSISKDVEEIKDNVQSLLIYQASKEAEAKALRRMAVYVSGLTTGAIQIGFSFIKAWWVAKV